MKNLSKKYYLLPVFCTMLIFLSSCLIPEKFDVTININKDGTFSFVYDGILTFVLAKAAAVEGSLSSKDERELKAMGDQEFRNDSHFKKMKYIGKGRYEVLYKEEGPLKGEENFFDLITISPLKDNKVAIRSIKLSKEDIKQFDELKMNIAGTIAVKTNGKVLNHNGNKSFFGSSYSWKIKSVNDPAPEMLIQLGFPSEGPAISGTQKQNKPETSDSWMYNPKLYKTNKKLETLIERENLKVGISKDETMRIYAFDKFDKMKDNRIWLTNGSQLWWKKGVYTGTLSSPEGKLEIINKNISFQHGEIDRELVMKLFQKKYGTDGLDESGGSYFIKYNKMYLLFHIRTFMDTSHKPPISTLIYSLHDNTDKVVKQSKIGNQ